MVGAKETIQQILDTLFLADDRLLGMLSEGDYTEGSDMAMFELDLARQRLVEVIGLLEDLSYE